MVSGTPVLTTLLPGMPKEYHEYVYLFDKETPEGYRRVLKEVLTLPTSELQMRGNDAKHWVLKYKNNKSQAFRILELINSSN